MNDSSLAQKQYVQKQKKFRRSIHFSRLLLFLLFLIFWETTAFFKIIDPFIFSSPSRIVSCFWNMLQKESLLFHIGITLFETLISFVLVIFFALGITILLCFSPRLSAILEPFFVILNSLPKSALAPLLIVWLGANYQTIIVTGMSVSVFSSILSLYTNFKSTDEEKIKLIYTLGGKKIHAMTKVILPANIPELFSLMRVNIGLCLVGVIIGEFMAAKSGLGYLIIYGSQVFKLDWVIMSIILLCIISTLFYVILGILEKKYLERL